MSDFSALYSHERFHVKCYEPVPRNHDGWRFHGHRFPIKGGISWREAMVAMNRNVLFDAIKEHNRMGSAKSGD